MSYLCCMLWAWLRRAAPASANSESPRKQLVWSESELLERHPIAVCFAVGANREAVKTQMVGLGSFHGLCPHQALWACTGAESGDHGTSRIDPLATPCCKKAKYKPHQPLTLWTLRYSSGGHSLESPSCPGLGFTY